MGRGLWERWREKKRGRFWRGCGNPDDWDEWRVFADWLTERGDVRGQLVMLGHRLATEPLSPGARAEVARQVRTLEEAHRQHWLSGLVPRETTFEWQHGFVVGVVPGRWSDRTLSLLEALVAHPTAALLRSLDLSHNGLGAEGAAALAGSDSLRSLTTLDLTHSAIGDEGAAALAGSDNLRSLTTLTLSDTDLGDEGAAALARSDSLRSLTTLNLDDNTIGDEGAVALARSDSLGSLTTLDLCDNAIAAR